MDAFAQIDVLAAIARRHGLRLVAGFAESGLSVA